MSLDHLLHEMQAEPGASGSRLKAVEGFEHGFTVFGGNARAVVLDLEGGAQNSHRHLAAAVFDRILDEIGEDPLDRPGVAPDRQRLVDLDRDASA